MNVFDEQGIEQARKREENEARKREENETREQEITKAREQEEARTALYQQHRQQPPPATRTIIAGPQLRVITNANGGKRTQRRQKQQRKMKHKRYSSRYKNKLSLFSLTTKS
jgi:hypothetical protein